ncbi:MAG: hypothetical protein AB7E47_03120 [Desulfovibrionaceae bacterium]
MKIKTTTLAWGILVTIAMFRAFLGLDASAFLAGAIVVVAMEGGEV